MLTPEEQMQILKGAITQGYKGPVYKLIDEANVQRGQTAETETQQEEGLRGSDGNTAMAFPESNDNFNTEGMDFPIDIRKYDKEGNLVRSYNKVSPGIKALDMGEEEGTVIETPSQYQKGGFNTFPRILSDLKAVGDKEGKVESFKDLPILNEDSKFLYHPNVNIGFDMMQEKWKNRYIDVKHYYDAYVKGDKKKLAEIEKYRKKNPQTSISNKLLGLAKKSPLVAATLSPLEAGKGSTVIDPETGINKYTGEKEFTPFQKGGVRKYQNAGFDKDAFINQFLEEEKTGTTKTAKNKGILSNTVSTTQGSKYYNKDGSPMSNEQKNILDAGNRKASIKYREEAKEKITDPVNVADVIGATGIPIVSEAGDLVSAGISHVRGDKSARNLSLAGIAVPFAGGAAFKHGVKPAYNVINRANKAKLNKQLADFKQPGIVKNTDAGYKQITTREDLLKEYSSRNNAYRTVNIDGNVMKNEELLKQAEKYGFDPSDPKQLAEFMGTTPTGGAGNRAGFSGVRGNSDIVYYGDFPGQTNARYGLNPQQNAYTSKINIFEDDISKFSNDQIYDRISALDNYRHNDPSMGIFNTKTDLTSLDKIPHGGIINTNTIHPPGISTTTQIVGRQNIPIRQSKGILSGDEIRQLTNSGKDPFNVFKKGGLRKYSSGGLDISLTSKGSVNCGPGSGRGCGRTESPLSLQTDVGTSYNIGNKAFGASAGLGLQGYFGGSDTRAGAPIIAAGLRGKGNLKLQEDDATIGGGLDLYGKVGFKKKNLEGAHDWSRGTAGFEAGAYTNYDLLDKKIKDIGVYGGYGALEGSLGYDLQNKGIKAGIGLTFKKGGVRKYHEGGTAEQEHMDMMSMGTLDAHNSEGNTGGDTGSMYGPNSDNPQGPPPEYGAYYGLNPNWNQSLKGFYDTAKKGAGFGIYGTGFDKLKQQGLDAGKEALGKLTSGIQDFGSNISGLFNRGPMNFQEGGEKLEVQGRREDLKREIDNIVSRESKSTQPRLRKLLEVTNFMENSMGENPEAYNRSYTNSQASIDPIMLNDLFDEKIDEDGVKRGHTETQKRYFTRLRELGLPTTKAKFKKELNSDNPKAAVNAMRMVYGKVPEALPEITDTAGMFKYYNDNYRRNPEITDLTKSRERFYEGYKMKFKKGGYKSNSCW